MSGKPINDSGEICPLHNKDVAKVCHKCPWYQKVVGSHPQTGEHIDNYECAIAWMPALLIENSQQQRQTAASVDKLTNNTDRYNSVLVKLAAATNNIRLIGAEDEVDDRNSA